MSKRGIIRPVLDAWQNIFTGVGIAGRDKRTGNMITSAILDQTVLESLYQNDPIARKIVNRIPSDGTREWIKFSNIKDKEVEKNIVLYLDNLQAKEKFKEAWQWARLYGGSAILIGFDDIENLSDLANPVDFRRVSKINSLTVFSRWELTSNQEIDEDIDSKTFGMPLTYQLFSTFMNSAITIHHTRLIRFDGVKLPNRLFIENNYWHQSVLQTLYEPLSNYAMSNNNAAGLLQDVRISVLKIENLSNQIASGTEENYKKIKARIDLLDLMKSNLKTMVIDGSESYENLMTSLSGIRDIVDISERHLVASTDLPHTIILGDSPSGLGATGESESMGYYDHVKHQQVDILTIPITTLVDAILLSSEGPTKGQPLKDWNFDFVALWQRTEKEQAELEKIVAEKDAIYIQNNVLDPADVLNSRYGGTEYSTSTSVIDLESRINEANAQTTLTPEEQAAYMDILNKQNVSQSNNQN